MTISPKKTGEKKDAEARLKAQKLPADQYQKCPSKLRNHDPLDQQMASQRICVEKRQQSCLEVHSFSRVSVEEIRLGKMGSPKESPLRSKQLSRFRPRMGGYSKAKVSEDGRSDGPQLFIVPAQDELGEVYKGYQGRRYSRNKTVIRLLFLKNPRGFVDT